MSHEFVTKKAKFKDLYGRLDLFDSEAEQKSIAILCIFRAPTKQSLLGFWIK